MDDKKIMLYAALAIVAVCFLYFFLITFLTIPQSVQRYADLILGFLTGGGFGVIMTFYWGSSKGSADKTEALMKE